MTTTSKVRTSLGVVAVLALAACGELEPAVIEKNAQSINFGALPDRLTTDPPFELQATISSGLPITFSADGACSVDGRTVTLSGEVGSCTITASQPGNGAYEPADDVARAFEVRTPPAVIDQVGFALISESGGANARTIGSSASFALRDEPIEGDRFSDPFGDDLGTCEIAANGDTAPTEDPIDAPAAGTPIGAGTALQVSHDGEPFATLASEDLGSYQLDAATLAAGSLPDGDLTLAVPGDTFPTFAARPFVPAAAFALADGFDPSTVDRNTTFAWEPGQGNGSAALLIGGDGSVLFSCVVPDDGSFTFDEETRDALENAGFVAGSLQIAGRLTLDATIEGKAALLLGVLRLTNYGQDGSSQSALAVASADPQASASAALASVVEAVATGSAPPSDLAARLLRHSR